MGVLCRIGQPCQLGTTLLPISYIQISGPVCTEVKLMLVYLALHSLYAKCLNFIHKKRYMCISHSAKGPCNKKFKPYFPTKICSLQKIKGWPARLIDIYIYIYI